MARVDQKVYVITDGANGIGRTKCDILAGEGAHVAITDFAEDDGEHVALAIRSPGGKASFGHRHVDNEHRVNVASRDHL